MAIPFDKLPQWTNKLAVAVEGSSEETVKRAAIKGHEAAVRATPVRTGRLRSNWTLSKGSPSSRLREPPAGGLTVGQATASAFGTRATIRSFSLKKDGRIVITNNTPYVNFVDLGTRFMAPRGMSAAMRAAIRRELTVWQRIFRRVRTREVRNF